MSDLELRYATPKQSGHPSPGHPSPSATDRLRRLTSLRFRPSKSARTPSCVPAELWPAAVHRPPLCRRTTASEAMMLNAAGSVIRSLRWNGATLITPGRLTGRRRRLSSASTRPASSPRMSSAPVPSWPNSDRWHARAEASSLTCEQLAHRYAHLSDRRERKQLGAERGWIGDPQPTAEQRKHSVEVGLNVIALRGTIRTLRRRRRTRSGGIVSADTSGAS